MLAFLDTYPVYEHVLVLAVRHEEEGMHQHGYRGWQWNDVEIHPTKLVRLVVEGISRINIRTRQATFYLLRERDQVKQALDLKRAQSSSSTNRE